MTEEKRQVTSLQYVMPTHPGNGFRREALQFRKPPAQTNWACKDKNYL